MQRGLVGSEMCIRDRYQRRVHGFYYYGIEQVVIFIVFVFGVVCFFISYRKSNIEEDMKTSFSMALLRLILVYLVLALVLRVLYNLVFGAHLPESISFFVILLVNILTEFIPCMLISFMLTSNDSGRTASMSRSFGSGDGKML
eukprot:TRINITY_DN38216_c0_g1_i2.p1 TRINITY_DN38216_c0_g1~~TRINITY_DN38216_c0_g1_i2.p1  ORF type:complete len:143 (-),score=20.51 TRINITY_DN38216_c0_g1_i2:144-572(-)